MHVVDLIALVLVLVLALVLESDDGREDRPRRC